MPFTDPHCDLDTCHDYHNEPPLSKPRSKPHYNDCGRFYDCPHKPRYERHHNRPCKPQYDPPHEPRYYKDHGGQYEDWLQYEPPCPPHTQSYKLQYERKPPPSMIRGATSPSYKKRKLPSYELRYEERKPPPCSPSTSTLSYEQRPTLAKKGSQERPAPPQDQCCVSFGDNYYFPL
eukprot:jgi/Psemu1/27936/gm1.27936_g